MLYSASDKVIDKGYMELKREKRSFGAGFCLIKEPLADLTENLNFLHVNEKKYYDTLSINRRKLSYLLGRKTAKEAIAALTPEADFPSIAIEFGIFQFPVVKSPILQNIQVSISHCDEVAVALAFPEEHPMGIDIESVSHHKSAVMRSYISPLELELIGNADLVYLMGSTILWTVKEALSKVLRTGLMIDPRVTEIKSIQKAEGFYETTFYNFAQYKAVSITSKYYVCSFVIPKNTTPFLESFSRSFMNLTTL